MGFPYVDSLPSARCIEINGCIKAFSLYRGVRGCSLFSANPSVPDFPVSWRGLDMFVEYVSGNHSFIPI